ncbi:uncharacterized protein N7484_011569 [Penicillium longicatenatum]|uniref:uncharacterized protein n=1 Tax=Penicillium longicatenatum TaxID=1561947 RepID=UPI002547F8A0|nr:uncharacterized protein N7484_011569 [Penicillium longicatenatum]KAJ5631469.1 hypothetical protein N7484_011569 [Penicillium longicatenatum]
MSATSKTTIPAKKPTISHDDLLGMSASEIRLLLLASVVQDKDAKPDAEQIALICGLTKGSVKVLIPKAKKKLLANIEDGLIPSKSPATKPVAAKPAKPAKATPTKAPAAKRPRKRKAEPELGSDDESEFEALVRAESSEPEQGQQQDVLGSIPDDF